MPIPTPPVNGAAAPVVQAAPAARVVVELQATGQITMHATVTDPLRILGLLEMAKAAVIQQSSGEGPSRIVPARFGG